MRFAEMHLNQLKRARIRDTAEPINEHQERRIKKSKKDKGNEIEVLI